MTSPRSRRMSCDMFTLPSARPADLGALLDFTDDFCEWSGIGEEDAFALQLAIEEVSVNIMLHGYDLRRPGPIELSLCATEDAIMVTIRDRAQPFNPVDAPQPDLDATWDQRQIGGLGWHLVREFMDGVDYRYDPAHGNVVNLVRKRTAG